MAHDNRGKDKIENGLRHLGNFLRARSLPGKVLANRKESPEPGKATKERLEQSPPSSPSNTSISGNRALHSRSSFVEDAGEERTASPGAPSPHALHDARAGLSRLDVRNGVHSPGQGTEEPSTSGLESPTHQTVLSARQRSVSAHRVKRFHKLLAEPVIDIEALRELSWSGIPPELRPTCWRLLLGYIPPSKSRQVQALARKRREYTEMVPEFYDIANSERSEEEVGALRQVSVDVPRTAPTVPFFHQPSIQKSLERMLYIWGIRHPASGYVQGMNDLVTPFLAVFLSEHLRSPMDSWVAQQLSEAVMLEVEADCYWCLCKMLESIQDHYIYAQPGIQRTVFRLQELIRRIDEPAARHLETQTVDFLQFAFRWVNCLLIREMPFPLALRLWDTYLAEGGRFSDFLVYVCVAFLLNWSDQLKQMEFQDLIIFLQKLPTNGWEEQHVEAILSRAYILRTSFGDAQSHLKS